MIEVLSRPELLTGRSAEVGKSASAAISALLERYIAQVPGPRRNIIARGEEERAIVDYKQRRAEGGANDIRSNHPGFTMYVDKKGLDSALMQCERGGYPIPETDIRQVNEKVFSIRFPKGLYYMSHGGHFSTNILEEDQKGAKKAANYFGLGWNHVIRVEGDVGETPELWQNQNYNWDGSRKGEQGRAHSAVVDIKGVTMRRGGGDSETYSSVMLDVSPLR